MLKLKACNDSIVCSKKGAHGTAGFVDLSEELHNRPGRNCTLSTEGTPGTDFYVYWNAFLGSAQ